MNIELDKEVVRALLKEEFAKIDIEGIVRNEAHRILTKEINVKNIGEKKLSTWYRERIARVIDKSYVSELLSKEDLAANALVDSIVKRTNLEERVKTYAMSFMDRISSIIKNEIRTS